MSKLEKIAPSDVAAPVGPYSHGIVAQGPGRWLSVAGQVGVRPDGSTPADFAGQADAAWANVQAVLRAAGMEISDITKVVSYLTDVKDLATFGPIRARYLGEHRPASTLVGVAALARPEWRVEVEVYAFHAD
jgi:2-iminobutanoate/2-iminopropanoate deaminase